MAVVLLSPCEPGWHCRPALETGRIAPFMVRAKGRNASRLAPPRALP